MQSNSCTETLRVLRETLLSVHIYSTIIFPVTNISVDRYSAHRAATNIFRRWFRAWKRLLARFVQSETVAAQDLNPASGYECIGWFRSLRP